jgi:hypothetical protein
MSSELTQDQLNKQLESKAKAADSAERREDYVVLMLAGITVALVLTGAIGPGFFKSLFF